MLFFPADKTHGHGKRTWLSDALDYAKLMRGIFLSLCLLTSSVRADPDLPPVGRSMFDYFVHANGGKLPSDVRDLVSSLERLGGNRVATILQPDSRSSQRPVTDDEHPRILGVGGEPRFSRRARDGAEAAGRIETDKIFFAYSERARTLEILSYNPKAARNEIQFIRDFGTPNARLFYVRRRLCVGCHVDGTPIFSRFPWSDTDQVDAVATRLRRALGARHYQGLPIGRAGGFTFTRRVEEAAKRTAFFSAWREGFPEHPEAGRRLLLATLLGHAPTAADAVHVAPFSSSIAAPLPLLPDRIATPRPAGVKGPAVAVALQPRPFFSRNRVPLVPTGKPLGSFALDLLARGGATVFSGELRRTLEARLAHAPARAWSESERFDVFVRSERAPNPYELHRALSVAFDGTQPSSFYLTDADGEMPPPILAEDGSEEEEAEDDFAGSCPRTLAEES